MAEQKPIISIDHVSMRFNLAKEKHESLKEYFVALLHGGIRFDEFFALDDVSFDGMSLVADIVSVFRQYGLETKVIAASVRHPLHVVEAAKAGADIATIPYKVLKQMIDHPLTKIGIERFLADWEKVNKG